MLRGIIRKILVDVSEALTISIRVMNYNPDYGGSKHM